MIDSEEKIKIAAPTVFDAIGSIEVQYKAWLATYPNAEAGITVEDIEDRYKNAFTEDRLKEREKLITDPDPNEKFIVAKDGEKAKEPNIEKYVGIYRNRLTGKIYSAYKKGKMLFEFETFNTLDEARALYRAPERLAKLQVKQSSVLGWFAITNICVSTAWVRWRRFRCHWAVTCALVI